MYVGSGAVNLCLAGWIHSGTSVTQFLVRTPENELIKAGAFQCRFPGDKNTRIYECQAFASLEGVQRPDLVVIGVKGYSLDDVLNKIEAAFGNEIPVMSVLNGVEHVNVISKRFKHALFATIIFNAYRISPISAVAVGRSIALSSSIPQSRILKRIRQVLSGKMSVSLVKDPLDAAHCKLIINLNNALLTIVAFHNHRSRELEVLHKLTTQILNEGLDVLKASGVKEAKISGMPSWLLIRLTKWLPQSITLPIFEKKMRANSINSMAQDMEAGRGQTELEEINGYFIQMADKKGMDVPHNRALYHIFKEWNTSGGQPLTPSELLSRINSFSKR